jgi:N-acyl homoserine lactone hydrolase
MSSESTGPDLVQRLYVLDYGLFQVHSNQRIIGIPGYLIQTLDDVNILVDTGFPARYVDDPDGAARKIPVQSPA